MEPFLDKLSLYAKGEIQLFVNQLHLHPHLRLKVATKWNRESEEFERQLFEGVGFNKLIIYDQHINVVKTKRLIIFKQSYSNQQFNSKFKSFYGIFGTENSTNLTLTLKDNDKLYVLLL